MFKVGQKIVCVAEDTETTLLKLDTIYTVKTLVDLRGVTLCEVDVPEEYAGFENICFRPLTVIEELTGIEITKETSDSPIRKLES